MESDESLMVYGQQWIASKYNLQASQGDGIAQRQRSRFVPSHPGFKSDSWKNEPRHFFREPAVLIERCQRTRKKVKKNLIGIPSCPCRLFDLSWVCKVLRYISLKLCLQGTKVHFIKAVFIRYYTTKIAGTIGISEYPKGSYKTI